MSESPATTFRCTQCAGELHPDEGQMFVTCPYCSSTVYLDKSRVVFHWYLAPTLDGQKARAGLARWMAGNQTVKDLDQKVGDVRQGFHYFPVWYFKRRRSGGKEEILLEPAAATSVSEIKRVRLPAGDLRKYDPALDDQAQPPTVPLDAAMNWLKERQIQPDEIVESALVHVPLYVFKYVYNKESYTAVVEGATGTVLANIFPAKAEAPYVAVAGLTAGTFLCLATLPIIGALAYGGEGLGIGVLAMLGLGLLALLALFVLATWVASKI
ncbi:MAG: hypothetical protein JXD18_06850 [Anaerolineae bacterium]|nr:hypothetical protein [Anaerolineae bacterium]